ncbi:UBA domain-containing protein [Aphelenchoides bicaudatus]|nr:UBA domain-containing protein [Aphelenchoides bicaudatus]
MVNIVYNSGPRVPVDSNLTIAQAIDKVVSSSDLEYYVYFNDHKLDNSTVINQIPGIKDDYTLRVVCTKYTDLQMPENTMKFSDFSIFAIILTSWEHMLTKFPALSTDSELISILPKPSLFISILKSKDDEYEKEHPLFIPAIFGILEKTFNSDVLNRLRAKHSSSSNQMFSAANLQQYLGLLPNSSSAPALRPTSSNTNRITSEMFNNALQSLGGASSSMSTQPIQPTQPAQQVPPEKRFSTQLNELAMMGFINRDVNIQALLATDGNVNLAVEWLIESGLI